MPAVLVFGARNLGRAIGKHLAADGWKAAAFATRAETIDRFRAEIPGAIGFRGDARSEAHVQAALNGTREQLGSVDLVVNAITARPRGTFGGGPLMDAGADAMEPYVDELLPAIFNVLRLGGKALSTSGGTMIQITGGSARRAIPERGPWSAAAAATRALVQAAAQELRPVGVHVALLIVDAAIANEQSAAWTGDKPAEQSTTEDDVARAVSYLAGQSSRGWTHELAITPRLDRWIP